MLLHPIWLLLAIPLALTLWLWRMPTRLLMVLRGLTFLLLLLALCGAVLRLPSQAGTIVVVADRSQSMPPGSATAQKEVLDLLHKAMGPNDRLAVVSFGRTVAVEQPPASGQVLGFVHEFGDDASNLADGLDTALTLIPRDTPGKILAVSDGRWTGRDPAVLAARASGGKERLELASVWKELPRHVRLVPLAPWLLLAVVVLLLLEVFESRSGLLSRRGRRAGESIPQPCERTGWFARKRPRSTAPLSSPPSSEPPPSRHDEVRETARDESAMLDALRKARERSRGRTE